jgi:hypothetical protein
MNYTISAAFVLDVEPDKLADRDGDELHVDILQHLVTLGELMKAKHSDRAFRVVLSDMIVSTPEHEI